MSRYADLRWKIADLEKALEKEKNCTERLFKELSKKDLQIASRDKEIENLRDMINRLCVEINGKSENA